MLVHRSMAVIAGRDWANLLERNASCTAGIAATVRLRSIAAVRRRTARALSDGRAVRSPGELDHATAG